MKGKAAQEVFLVLLMVGLLCLCFGIPRKGDP